MGAPTVAPQQGALIEQPAQRAAAAPVVMAPAAPPAKAYPPKMAAAILRVTREINPVQKAGWNEFHKYAYRKFEDVFEELVPLINQHGLIIEQTEIRHATVLEGMVAITYQFTIINEDGDVWPTHPEFTQLSKVKDAKGILDDKAASKCCTQAQKYFYTSFFKIRSVDVSEADADAGGERPARRTAPSPDGVFKPHEVAIQKDETAEAWADRFKAMLKHAKTPEDVDAWYAANQRIFARLESNPGYAPLYQALIDAMDRRALEVAPKQEQQQEQQTPSQAQDDGFPGDKPMTAAATMPDIPQNLRRAPAPPGAQQAIPAEHQKWLDDLEAEYQACGSVDELSSAQDSVMIPWKDHVGQEAWKQAMAITAKHLERLGKANG